MRILGKVLAVLVAGTLFTFLGAMAITLPFGDGAMDSWGGYAMLLLFISSIAITWLSSTAGKAWRYLLIGCAVFTLLMPISTFILGLVGINQMALEDPSGASSAGYMIGSGMATVTMGVLSFFIGAVFLILALLCGRDRKTA